MAAVNVIAFPVGMQQNQNTYSNAYGKYYFKPWYPSTLTLKGLIDRVAFEQSVYSRDIVEGVVQKLTTVMVELLKSGQPVKWDGLGTFTPTIENDGTKVTNDPLTMSVDAIKGVHIAFIPENSKGEELTSRAFKDLCTFDVVGIINTTNIGTQQKPKYVRTIITLDAYKAQQQNGGSSSSSGEEGGGPNAGD